jgi:SAM-dependent methyltransferase
LGRKVLPVLLTLSRQIETRMAGTIVSPEPIVEIDTDEEDSTLGDDVSTSSTSVASSVLRYEWKHGRRYHSYHAGTYNFPNDEREQDRLDMIHHVFYRLLHDRLFLAPIDPDDGLRVLDIGTGTGMWPVDLGDQFPKASLILGNDLSPIQPKLVPPNVKFIVDDVEQEWAESQPFDYIHCRYMAGSIRNWPRLIQQCYENLKPGGWLELQESANTLYSEDNSLKPDNAMVKMMDGLMEACEKIGRTMNPAPSMKGWVEAAGFVNINQQSFKLPIGSWPKDPRLKEIGTFMGINFVEGVEAFTAALFKDVLGWTPNEVQVLNAQVRESVQRKDAHPLFDFLVITSQKPA